MHHSHKGSTWLILKIIKKEKFVDRIWRSIWRSREFRQTSTALTFWVFLGWELGLGCIMFPSSLGPSMWTGAEGCAGFLGSVICLMLGVLCVLTNLAKMNQNCFFYYIIFGFRVLLLLLKGELRSGTWFFHGSNKSLCWVGCKGDQQPLDSLLKDRDRCI